MVGAKRARREVGPGEPVSAVNDVRAPVAIEVTNGAAFVRVHEELFFGEQQNLVVGAVLHGAAGEDAQQENTCHERRFHGSTPFTNYISVDYFCSERDYAFQLGKSLVRILNQA